MSKIAVITGASDGIGLAAARKFLYEGWTVINLSRRPSPAEGVINIKTDITDEENVKASFQQIEDEYGVMHVLVNNAGYGISGAVEFTEIDDAKRQFDVNLFGAVACIKAAIPMLKISHGKIINISSAAAIFAMPFQSFYSASKASLDMLTLALVNELKSFGISVCSLRLGDVKTSFTSSRRKSFVGDDVYDGMISRSVGVMEHDEENGATPEFIADAIYKVAVSKRKKAISAVGMKYKVLTTINDILPAELVNDIVGKIYMPKG